MEKIKILGKNGKITFQKAHLLTQRILPNEKFYIFKEVGYYENSIKTAKTWNITHESGKRLCYSMSNTKKEAIVEFHKLLIDKKLILSVMKPKDRQLTLL